MNVSDLNSPANLKPYRRRRKRTREEKRRAVIALLLDHNLGEWSDSVLALRADVSAPFVGQIRRALSQSVLGVHTTKRRGADGVLRNVKKIGRRASVTQYQRERVLVAIHQGAWTMAELLEESGLARPKLKTILDDLVQAKIVVETPSKRKNPKGGRPELLYIPNSNHAPQN